jgi:hypothetical protein
MSVCPFADQSRRYDSAFPTQVYRGGPNKGVLHTTETTGLPGYSGGSMAPHFTVVPNLSTRTVKIYQHFDTRRPSRALVDLSGGVQTNNDGVVQIELAGTCSTSGPGLFWPTAPEWALDPVRELLGWINADRGIPLVGPPRGWLSYPASYGRSAVRMTPTEWDNFAGWCGHQHVPENDHGDPGDLSNLINGDDMFTDKDRELLQYVSAQAKAVAQLSIDLYQREAARDAAWQAALSEALKGAGVDPALVKAAVDEAMAGYTLKVEKAAQ